MQQLDLLCKHKSPSIYLPKFYHAVVDVFPKMSDHGLMSIAKESSLGYNLETSGDPRDYTKFPKFEIDVFMALKLRRWVEIYKKTGIWPDPRFQRSENAQNF